MLSDNPIQKCRDIINRTAMSLRKEAPQAWEKLLHDEQKEGFHPANARRENKYCQQIHNEIYMRASAEKREPTDTEYEAMQCLENVLELNNLILEEKYDIEHNYRSIDDLTPPAKKAIFGKGERLALPFRPENYDGIHLGHIMKGMAVGAGGNMKIQNALSEGTDSAGGYTVPIEILREFLDLLRAKTQLFNAGAKTVLLDSKKTNMATINRPRSRLAG